MAFIQFCYFLRWWIYDNNRLSALVDKAVHVVGVARVNSVTRLVTALSKSKSDSFRFKSRFLWRFRIVLKSEMRHIIDHTDLHCVVV